VQSLYFSYKNLTSSTSHSQDEDITDMESLRRAGVKAAIDDSVLDKMASLMKTEEVKAKLKQRTQEALDLGVSSLMRVQEEWVWSREKWARGSVSRGDVILMFKCVVLCGCGLGVRIR